MIPRIVELMAKQEGWDIPGVLPTRKDNPLDLEHAPGESHPAAAPDSIGSFQTPADGWDAGLRQVTLWASRGLTIAQAMAIQAPAAAGNNTAEYIANISAGLGLPPTALMSEAITIAG